MDSEYDPLLSGNPPNQKFAEIYCNYMGVLSFHCVLCPTQMNQDEFLVHYMIHFRDLFVVKQEVIEEYNSFEPTVGTKEVVTVPAAEEIKLELPQASGYTITDIRSEPSDSENSDPSADQSSSEVEPTVIRRKRGRPKNSVKFDEPKECGICGKSFVMRTLFKEHIRIHQCGPTPKFFECDICGRKASKFKNLIDHFRYKHTQSKIQCEVCKKIIRRNYKVAHMKRHFNERNFKCMLCDKVN